MRSEKLQIFIAKTFVLLHPRYLELVHYIKNGYNKQINFEKEINFENNLKFGKKFGFTLLEKTLLEFLSVFYWLRRIWDLLTNYRDLREATIQVPQ